MRAHTRTHTNWSKCSHTQREKGNCFLTKKKIWKLNHLLWQVTITITFRVSFAVSCTHVNSRKLTHQISVCTRTKEMAGRMWFTLVFKAEHSRVLTEEKMMHKHCGDYTGDLWGLLSMKMQKNQYKYSSPHAPFKHASLAWRSPWLFVWGGEEERGGEGEEGRKWEFRGSALVLNALRSVFKPAERVQVSRQDEGKKNEL